MFRVRVKRTQKGTYNYERMRHFRTIVFDRRQFAKWTVGGGGRIVTVSGWCCVLSSQCPETVREVD